MIKELLLRILVGFILFGYAILRVFHIYNPIKPGPSGRFDFVVSVYNKVGLKVAYDRLYLVQDHKGKLRVSPGNLKINRL